MSKEFLKAAGGVMSGSYDEREARVAFRDGLRLLDDAVINIAEAGRLFASIPEADWMGLVSDAPAPMRRTLGNVRDVGMGLMIPQLATASGEAVNRLRSFPIDEQLRLWREPVEVFLPGRVGRHAKAMRYVTEMQADEAKRVFAKGPDGWHVRSYDEQRAWEAEQASKQASEDLHGVDRPGRWAVRNGRIWLAAKRVNAGLTRKDVEAMLKDLTEEGGQ